MTTAANDPIRLKRIRAGLYKYGEHMIIRTDWGGEGPRGGTRYVWEVGYFDEQGVPTIDGVSGQFRTLRAAIAELTA